MDPDLDVRSDDIQQFEFLSNDLDNNIDKCLDLIISHHLILLPELSPAVHIRLFQLMNKKPDFVLGLIASGHLPLAEVNDSLVQLVLSHEHPNYALLQRLVDVGFTISDACLLTLLKQGSIVNSLEQISQLVPKATLRKHCLTVLKTMFGGEGGFHPFSCTKLVQFFEISEQEIAPMILHKLELQIQDPKFSNKNLYCPFKTRAFPKTDPVSCWFWIRNFYGPGHWFSLKSYQDLLLWIDDHRNGFDGDQEQKIKKALNVFLADKSVFSPEHLLTLKSIHGQPFKSQIACRILFDYSSYLDTHHLPMYQNQIWKKHLDDILGSKWHRHSSKSFDLEPPYQQFTLQKTLKMFKPESWSFRRKSQPETDLFMEIAYKMHQQISGKLNNQLPTFKTR
ncbi:hypothetical protein EDD86DRAFT_113371 [Gorgonomyces haynaldii]|nr:hypothetical protein EDD86DRAFT_113371 [Gorgonomyces haynaldii]